MAKYKVRFKNHDNDTVGSIRVNAFDENDAIKTAKLFLVAAVKRGRIRPTKRTIISTQTIDN